jgi:subtilase family serine protease
MRIAVVDIDGIKRSDLVTFARCFGLRMPQVRIVPLNLRRPLAAGAEATLDLEVIMAGAPRLSHLDLYEAFGSEADLVRLFAAPLDQPRARRPDVISSSLGNCEAAYSRAGLEVFERVLATAAASGVTVVSGSGDDGSSDCAQTTGDRGRAVDYPGTSRWVTSVGGTAIELNAANRLVAESVWNDRPYGTLLAGGGGASELFRRPAWQRAPGVSGRARLVPDVSFMADLAPGYAIYCTAVTDETCRGRGWFGIGGTSASAPLFASALALADQAARRRGLPRVGNINPLLYALARRAGGSRGPLFRDIRRGDNDLFDVGCCTAGPNFDRASGLGSLDLAVFTDRALRAAPRPPFTG